MKLPRHTPAVAVAAVAVVGLAACGSGSGATSSSASGSSSNAKVTLTVLIEDNPSSVAAMKAFTTAYQSAHPNVTLKTETRPSGGDGENAVKTRLSTGTMPDMFVYNPGSLLKALNPAQNLVDISADPEVANLDKTYVSTVSDGGKVFGVPFGASLAGGFLYNKTVYSKLGLQAPTSWADFEANNAKIKAAGITPVGASYKDTWSAQLMVLSDYYNVQAADPSFAQDYTANKAKYASTPAALKGFQRLQEVREKGFINPDYKSATFDQVMKGLAEGKIGAYPSLSASIQGLPKGEESKINDIGFFPQPGEDSAKSGMTVWMPNSLYIAKNSKNADAAKQFLGFVASSQGCDIFTQATPPAGPYLAKGCTLPSDAITVAKDVQTYLDKGNVVPALEFITPVKGPSLDQITAQVGTGQLTAEQGAAAYDQDVAKAAKQLGLAGW